jgi:glycosyltransferase involved in cell wall biosynthesis
VRTRARVFSLFYFDWRYFRDVVRGVRPDVVHGWGTEDCYANTALRLAPKNHLIQIQGCLNACRARSQMHWVTRFSALSERRDLANARHVVAENDYSLSCATPYIKTDSLHVVEHPLRPEFLNTPPATGAAKQVLYVGVTEERKGIWDALAAFQQAAPPDWKMVIVGTSRAHELQRRLATPELAARFTHYPHLSAPRIVELLQASSVFLLPTWVDTGPTTLKEAMAMGLWPVCFDNTGPAHYLRKFQFGTLARDLDRADLTEKLRQVIASEPWREPDQREKIESAIRPHFRRERIWEDLQKLYRHIIATSS